MSLGFSERSNRIRNTQNVRSSPRLDELPHDSKLRFRNESGNTVWPSTSFRLFGSQKAAEWKPSKFNIPIKSPLKTLPSVLRIPMDRKKIISELSFKQASPVHFWYNSETSPRRLSSAQASSIFQNCLTPTSHSIPLRIKWNLVWGQSGMMSRAKWLNLDKRAGNATLEKYSSMWKSDRV